MRSTAQQGAPSPRPLVRIDRRLDGGLGGTIHLDGPALGADGEVRIEVETDGGLRRVRRPLVAPGGSTVTIRCGEGADLE